MVLRRLPLVVVAAIALVLTPTAHAEDKPRPVTRSISLTMAVSGMAVVPMAYRVAVTPATGASSLRAIVQVRSARGWVATRGSSMDRRGRAAGTLVSNRPGAKTYRAVLVSARGRVLAVTPPTTVTWSRLEHRIDLLCERTEAEVGIDVPCTITVSPAVRLEDMLAYLQFRDRTDWTMLEALRVRADGTARTHVAGLAPGIGEYRAILMRQAQFQASSAIVTVTYSDPASLRP